MTSMTMAAAQKRRKKYQQEGLRRQVKLTTRDLMIVRLFAQARFLSTSQIGRMLALHGFAAGGVVRRRMDGKVQKVFDPSALIKDRLTELYHGEILDRPHAGFVLNFPGSEQAIYTLGRRGPALLRKQDGEDAHNLDWLRKAALGSRPFIEHAVATNEFLIMARESVARRDDLTIAVGDDVLPDGVKEDVKRPWRLTARVMCADEQSDIGVVPDLGMVLTAGKHSLGYLGEICRGNEPCVRYRRNGGGKKQSDAGRPPTLVGTSILRKMLAYSALKRAGAVKERFGWRNFKVLFVCEGRERGDDRVALMQKTVARFVPDNRGLFLFADKKKLDAHGDILTFDWLNWQGEPQRLDPVWVAAQMRRKN